MTAQVDVAGTTHPAPLDQIYETLKSTDPQWLETALRTRWTELELKTLPRAETIPIFETALSTATLGPRPQRQYGLTAHASTPALSDHIDHFRAHNWSATALGAMSSWGQELRQLVDICLSTPTPTMIFWGAQRCCLFNEAYTPLLDNGAYWALGLPLAEVWPEFTGSQNPFLDALTVATTSALPIHGGCTCFFIPKDGALVEIWASFSVIPVHTSTGVQGYLNTVTDLTLDVVRQRRASLLADLEKACTAVILLADLGASFMKVLEPYDRDIPFAAFYQRIDAHQEHHGSTDAPHLMLTGTLPGPGSTVTKTALPQTLDDDAGGTLFGSAFKSAMDSGEIQTICIAQDAAFTLLQQHARSRIWSDPCSTVLLIPICQGQSHIVSSLLVLGINPRLRYDESYQHFVLMLRTHLHITISSLFVIEERRELTETLENARQDSKEMEVRFHRMADRSPVGMFEVGAGGELNYANDAWYDMTAHPRDQLAPLQWVSTIHPDDRGWFAETWVRLVAGEKLSFEIRFCKPYISDDYVDGQRLEGITWAAASAYAERDSDGNVLSVLGTTADISRHKWLEGFKERQKLEALELKKQQEAFMDMISHEARNPLSAITLCAESSLSQLSIEDVRTHHQSQAITAALDDLRTILACANHQKSIIDDVLTLSKINTGMLIVSPVPVQPTALILDSLSTFASAILQADIEVCNHTDSSYIDLGMDWVLLDPIRLQQILINLLSNAIKFTRDSPGQRRIDVTLSAHDTPPALASLKMQTPGVQAQPQANLAASMTYLMVTIEDTGCGIESEHLERLFERFEQGSSKTHVKYGGSGLGLHICRVLATLQGGQIDVVSQYSQGSTFRFYVHAERCPAPTLVNNDAVRPDALSTPSANSIIAASKAFGARATEHNHILLVEDNLVNQKVMRKHLHRLGYHVVVANHGQEALDYLTTTKVCDPDGLELDMILMDIEMPIMDGLTCVKVVRQLAQKTSSPTRLPIVAVTANARREQQDIALQAGFDAVVTKPFRIKELEHVLARYGLYLTA